MAAIRRVGPDVSVDEMAAEADVSKPVLYAEFGDKYGIADAIALHLVEERKREILAELAELGGTIELDWALRKVIEGFLWVVGDDPQIYGFVARSVRTNDKGLLDNPFVRSLQESFEEAAEVLAPGADPEVVRAMVHGTFGFMIGVSESWRQRQAPEREQLIDALVVGLGRALKAIMVPPKPPSTTPSSTPSVADT